ncbi:MAG TPA: Rab family GTPase [Thermoplasmata archaeon]|nr:Rab family GTPase [Thermoplasmata archaeon]
MLASPAYAAYLKAKVVLLGGLGVGKTSLIRRYVLDEFDDRYIVTLGAKVSKRPVDVVFPGLGPVRVDMTVWDTMGEESLRPTLTDIVLHGVKGVLAVCDVSDARTIAPMASWVSLAARLRSDVPVQVLVNKSDLPPRSEVVAGALGVGRRHAAPCYLTSAKTGDNVRAAFEDLALRIATRALAEVDARLDPVSLGMVVEASARTRSLADFATSTGLSAHAVLGRAEGLVRRGFLRIASIDLGPDGRPVLGFSATGKSFPPLEAGTATRSSGSG